jgi:hypothetical protein
MMKRTLIGLVLAAVLLITTDAAFAQCFPFPFQLPTSGSCHVGPQVVASTGTGCGFCMQCPFNSGGCTLHVEGSTSALIGLYNANFGNPRFHQSCSVTATTGCSVEFTRSGIFPGEPVPIGCAITGGVGVEASVDCSASLQ